MSLFTIGWSSNLVQRSHSLTIAYYTIFISGWKYDSASQHFVRRIRGKNRQFWTPAQATASTNYRIVCF